jgi:hypothetical protein
MSGIVSPRKARAIRGGDDGVPLDEQGGVAGKPEVLRCQNPERVGFRLGKAVEQRMGVRHPAGGSGGIPADGPGARRKPV